MDCYKGIVIEIKKEYGIVLTDSGEMVRIEKRDDLKIGKKIFFFSEDIVTKPKKTNTFFMKAIAACIILSLILSSQVTNLNTYAIVSIDINPSLELRVNKKDIVIGIITFNDEAKEIINDDFIGQEITIVLEEIINNAEKMEYLNEENRNILIASANMKNNNSNLSETIKEYIEAKSLKDNLNSVYIESKKEKAKESITKNVSLGKIELENIISKDNKEVTNDMTVKEMMKNEKVEKALNKKAIVNMKNNNSQKEKSEKSDKDAKEEKKSNNDNNSEEVKEQKANSEEKDDKKNNDLNNESKKTNQEEVELVVNNDEIKVIENEEPSENSHNSPQGEGAILKEDNELNENSNEAEVESNDKTKKNNNNEKTSDSTTHNGKNKKSN